VHDESQASATRRHPLRAITLSILSFLQCGDGTNCPSARSSHPYLGPVDFMFAAVVAAPIGLSIAVTMRPAKGRPRDVLARTSRRNAKRPADEYIREIPEIRR